jgi:two-component system, chemotaxis family, chemotaxis protein CheY
VMSGPECLKALRATEGFKEVPVLMCTARSEKAHVVEAVQLGISDYILKPFKIEAVLERVAKHLPPEKRAR